MAAVQVQVPVEVKIFMPAETAEPLRFAAQVPLHFREGLGRVHHREAAALFHLLDLLEDLNQFVRFVTDQVGIAKAEVTARQIRQRITERAALETQVG